MTRLGFGILLTALATLVLELMLTRVFDVVLAPNLAYFVVTSAVFAFGLAGIHATLRPLGVEQDVSEAMFARSAAFAVSTAVLIPLIDVLPLDYTRIGKHPVSTLLAFGALYVALVVPFFLAGSVLITAFSRYATSIQRLYAWDLIGAGLGSVLVVPFIAAIGPGGLMMAAASLALVAAALFSRSTPRRAAALVLALVFFALPVLKRPVYIDFTQHMEKRGVIAALADGRGEFVRWDPISKVNVIDETWSPKVAVPWWHDAGDRKAIQYDGGNQTSYMFKFDGDLPALREHLEHDKSRIQQHFWQLGVLASHYLKRDSGQSVLIIGSGGGQETKAALLYGPAHVDTVELVPSVVALTTGAYSHYIGDVFHNRVVSAHADEGRSFLRHSERKYDIIQVFSNHTSSSIAQGTGALEPTYLQTAEAYEEFFAHLTANGVLHINHHAYPRMITTAALAWKRLGRSDFARHVAVWQSRYEETLPTMLIKMQPWTAEELATVSQLLAPPELPPEHRMVLVENPLDPRHSFLSADFYSGDFPASLARRVPVNLTPRTDDRPYFGLLRKSTRWLKADPANYLDAGTAYWVNLSLNRGIPMDWIHLFLTGAASIAFIVLFVLLPLRYSAVGREEGVTAAPMLVYFSCLGAGFIALELVLIQKFTNLIGSPLYTYATVLCTLLTAAGIGSAASQALGIGTQRRWRVPFVGILIVGVALVIAYPLAAQLALGWPLAGRVLASGAMIFPLGFFLGMPFPLAILSLSTHPRGAVAWAWGMNGLFTVVGGLLSMVSSVVFGFNATILLALGLYVVALLLFSKLAVPSRRSAFHGPDHSAVAEHA
jgi:hypothetical protein